MNILVCIKRVPDTASAARPGADGKSVETAGVEQIISPFDEFAIQAGLDMKAAHGGEVTVLTVGPAEAQKELRSALALGADKAVLLKSPVGFADPLAVAKAVADYARDKSYAMIFCGLRATDDDNFQFGPLLARLLKIAHVSVVAELKVEGEIVRAKREIEGGVEIVETRLPCLITCQKDLNKPGYASLKGIMAAKKKPLEEIDAKLAANRMEVLSVTPPPARPAGRIVGQGAEAVPALIQALREEAKVL